MGVVELATAEEASEGEDATRAVTPAGLREALGAFLGIGFVAMWYGAPGAVPVGWAICNGQTVARSDGTGDITTPDLRDRAVVGAGSSYDVGDTFGATSKTVSSATAGAHDHEATLPDHSHDPGTLGVAIASSLTGSTFIYSTKGDTASGGSGKTLAVPPDANATAPPAITDPGHVHDATVSGATAAAGAATFTTTQDGVHSHDVTVDVSQPSLALHFIMRI
jgi:microcystin-dependent protein